MTNNLKTWPDRIYLQHGHTDDSEVPDFKECSDVTWCHESIFGRDVAYVRADLVQQIEPAELLLDWLNERVVDTIYLDDGTLIDVRGNDVRTAIRAIIAVTKEPS